MYMVSSNIDSIKNLTCFQLLGSNLVFKHLSDARVFVEKHKEINREMSKAIDYKIYKIEQV
jgi:hypothetical protein